MNAGERGPAMPPGEGQSRWGSGPGGCPDRILRLRFRLVRAWETHTSLKRKRRTSLPGPILGGLLLVLAGGCAADRPQLERALLADRNPAAHGEDTDRHYRVRCPDVLEIEVAGAPDWSGPRRVGADGRIGLAGGKRLRVDGQTLPAIAAATASVAHVDPQRVRVRVAEFNSQQVYLFGEVSGMQRALPYRGPETVLDLLQRAGGITPGAALTDVQVVRAHVADGTTPEVFHIDLEAIVRKKDQHTNIHLEPFDQVYIGQSRRSGLCPCVPPWLRPTYEALCGLRRPADAPAGTPVEDLVRTQ
jgi:protein involved in polysaccharide export with SLBB domain